MQPTQIETPGALRRRLDQDRGLAWHGVQVPPPSAAVEVIEVFHDLWDDQLADLTDCLEPVDPAGPPVFALLEAAQLRYDAELRALQDRISEEAATEPDRWIAEGLRRAAARISALRQVHAQDEAVPCG